jgi:hypothetical protein
MKSNIYEIKYLIFFILTNVRVHLIFEVFKLAVNIKILDVYLLFAILLGQIKSKLNYKLASP